jgi:hypothetical protein
MARQHKDLRIPWPPPHSMSAPMGDLDRRLAVGARLRAELQQDLMSRADGEPVKRPSE